MKKLSFFTLLLVLLLSACSADVDKGDQLEEENNTAEEPQETDETTEEPQEEEASDTTEASGEPAEEESTQETEEQPEAEQTEETEAPEQEADTKDNPADKEGGSSSAEADEEQKSTESETSESSSVGLKAYMPDGPMKKTFLQNGEYEATYEIIATDDQYVQQVITFGNMVTMQVLEWTEGRISLVYEESNPEDTSSQLDSFESYETIDVLVDVTNEGKSEGEWHIIDEQQTTPTEFKEFQDVFVVQRTTSAGSSGAKVTTVSYYAPGYGLIKEQVEDHGDNGYTMNSELTNIE